MCSEKNFPLYKNINLLILAQFIHPFLSCYYIHTYDALSLKSRNVWKATKNKFNLWYFKGFGTMSATFFTTFSSIFYRCRIMRNLWDPRYNCDNGRYTNFYLNELRIMENSILTGFNMRTFFLI